MTGDAGKMPGERGVVLRGTGGVWVVRTTDGETREATLRGRLKQAARIKLAVGDEVVLDPPGQEGTWAIAEIMPRRSVLARRAPGGGHGERVVAANIDQVIVVFAAARPEPHVRMLDRFLVVAEANELDAQVVVNKIDLAGVEATRERFADYPRAGYAVHFASVRTGEGLPELRESLAGRISAVSGPSGVGKSSLLNALYPGLDLRVGEISEAVNKGRHTTVGAWLHPLPGGGFVADTPGLREVGFWGLTASVLATCFPEFRPWRDHCRFADCSHLVEPGCAVRDAVERGEVSAARYDSFTRLYAELTDDS
jgi:ribosome biogenesis GTPase